MPDTTLDGSAFIRAIKLSIIDRLLYALVGAGGATWIVSAYWAGYVPTWVPNPTPGAAFILGLAVWALALLLLTTIADQDLEQLEERMDAELDAVRESEEVN